MLRLFVKNVGQGDSLILEWTSTSGRPKTAIIDCVSVGRRKPKKRRKKGVSIPSYESHIVPTVDHLIATPGRDIQFALLSHPHHDHYSGFVPLFDYLVANRRKVKRFFHTFHYKKEALIRLSEKYLENRRVKKPINLTSSYNLSFYELIETAGRMKNAGVIENLQALPFHTDGFRAQSFSLNNDFELHILAPSERAHLDILVRNLARGAISNDTDQGEDGDLINGLSSVILIKGPNHSLLLTADATLKSFDDILGSEELVDLTEGTKASTYRLFQLPHHGSEENRSEPFWKAAGLGADQDQAFISSGQNDKYKHPHKTVVDYVLGKGVELWATNHLYGLSNQANTDERYQGDKEFVFDEKGITRVFPTA